MYPTLLQSYKETEVRNVSCMCHVFSYRSRKDLKTGSSPTSATQLGFIFSYASSTKANKKGDCPTTRGTVCQEKQNESRQSKCILFIKFCDVGTGFCCYLLDTLGNFTEKVTEWCLHSWRERVLNHKKCKLSVLTDQMHTRITKWNWYDEWLSPG